MKYEKIGYIKENYHYFHLKDKEGQELDFHYHEFDKLIIFLSGKVLYAVENEEYEIKKGDILLVPHHSIHKASIDRSVNYERIIIYFNRLYLRSLVTSVDIMQSFSVASRKRNYILKPNDTEMDRIFEIIKAYEEIAQDKEFGAEAYRDTLMIQLLVQLGRIKFEKKKREKMDYDAKIEEILTYIYENLQEDLNVVDLAHRVHLSRSYFMHLFKSETGQTVHSYITQKRLLNAARLIREGIPVNIAAIKSGFNDYTSFYRSFKNAFGISPSDIANKKVEE